MVSQQVSFVERLSLSQRVPYRRFHCINYVLLHSLSYKSTRAVVKTNLNENLSLEALGGGEDRLARRDGVTTE